MSLLGWHLTPEPWCDAPHAPKPPFPVTLCGVKVLVAGRPAALMYVGETGNRIAGVEQINFRVPPDVTADHEVTVQVCVAAACSDPVAVPFTNKDIVLRVEENARVHMPLWVDYTIPFNDNFVYPLSPCPWDLGGFQIEVRKDGHVLPSRPLPKCPDVNPLETPSAMGPLRRVSRRLPVHLYHVFDVPGEYELRMSGPLLTPDLGNVYRTGYADWVRVTVDPFPDEARQHWLDEIAQAALSADTRRQATELIVSLLAYPDEKALKALLNFLPSPVVNQTASARRVSGDLGMTLSMPCPSRAATAALAAFPDTLLMKVIGPERLTSLRKPPPYCFWR